MTIGELIHALADDERLAIAANIGDIYQWELQLAKSDDDPIHRATAVLLQALGELVQPPETTAVAQERDHDSQQQGKRRGRSWVENKMINGAGPYAYRRWREGGRVKSEYVGKVKE